MKKYIPYLLAASTCSIFITHHNVHVSSFPLTTTFSTTSSSRTRASHSASFPSSYSSLSAVLTQTASSSSSSKTLSNNNDNKIIPFIIEELSQAKASKECGEIGDLVIKVFFEEEAELQSLDRKKSGLTPWKIMQLAYLKNLQVGDVKGKKFLLSRNINNSMFAARQIIPCVEGETVKSDERIDLNAIDNEKQKIYNVENLYSKNSGAGGTMYKKGPLLGFVDVSEKTFGLASDMANKVIQYEDNDSGNNDNNNDSPIKSRSLRPVLTNLSVQEYARRSGVGSALVDACENVVMTSWSTTYNEMVLEVESENELAQRFYEKRGYIAVYADPTSRRFDTSGIILRDVRTTKIAYRKELKSSNSWAGGNGGGLFDLPFFARVKSFVGGN